VRLGFGMALIMGQLLGHADRERVAHSIPDIAGRQFHKNILEYCWCSNQEAAVLAHTGLVTSRDIDMVKDRTTLLSDVMSKELVTLNARASYDDAVALLKVPRCVPSSLSPLSSPTPAVVNHCSRRFQPSSTPISSSSLAHSPTAPRIGLA